MTPGATDFPTLGPPPTSETRRVASIVARDAHGRVLMQLRDDFPHVAAAGKWSVFGGAVEGAETLTEAAQREFHEETGIALAARDLVPLARYASQTVAGDVIYAFACTRMIAPSDIQLSEGAGFGFLTADQIARFDVLPNVRLLLSAFPVSIPV